MSHSAVPFSHVVLLWLTLPAMLFYEATNRHFGCMPQSDPWFIAQRTTAPATPAPGVEIQPRGLDGHLLVIRNGSTTPLYLLQPLVGAPIQYLPDTNLPVPDNFVTNVKVVADDVIVMDRLQQWRPLAKVADNEWDMNGTGHHAFELRPSRGYIPNLEPLIPFSDNRPANVQVPPPTHADLHMLYGDQLISTPVITTTYALNPTYDPQKHAKGADRCARGNAFIGLAIGLYTIYEVFPLLIAIFCFMLAVLFLMYAIARYHKLN